MKKTALKARSQTPRAKVEAELDRLASEWCRSIRHCENCGWMWDLETHHIVSRRHKETRWLEANLVCLCADCHGEVTRGAKLSDHLRLDERRAEMQASMNPMYKPDLDELLEIWRNEPTRSTRQ
jgi:5-methylcytosine-specific restriction endonuclease McrA